MCSGPRSNPTAMPVVIVLALGLVLGGCWMPDPAYMFADKPRPKTAPLLLRLESVPPGAHAQTSFDMSCYTPCSLPMGGDGEFVVTFIRPGYMPMTIPITAYVPMSGREDAEISLDRASGRIAPNPVVAHLVRE